MSSPYSNRRQIDSLQKASQQRLDATNKRLNLAVAGAEKLGVSGGKAIQEFTDWEIIDVDKQEEAKKRKPIERGYVVQQAPTINPERPRAKKIGYSRDAQTLVVKFRGKKGREDEGPWCAYPDIPLTMWVQLRSSNSTGRYLRYSGLDDHPYEYINPSIFPEEIRVRFEG